MGGEWRETSLGDVIELKRGYDLPQGHRSPGKIPLVSSSGVTDHHVASMVRGPGVVTGRCGTLGKVFFVSDDFWPLNTTLYVRDFKGNDPRFISFFLRLLDFQAYSDKAAVPGLNRNHLHQARVRLPLDVVEQRAIAHILGTLEDKIDLNRRICETLDAIIEALFKSWFIDFDPVRARMEGRVPDAVRGLTEIFPESFRDSEIGEIPEGWSVAALPDLMDVNPHRALRKGDVAPYLDMANMPTRGHTPTDVVDRVFGSGMRFVNGDTLVARITPCLENGKTAFVDFLKEREVGWGSTEYIVLRAKPPLPPEFAYCVARSTAFRDFAIRSMTGSSGRQRVPAQSLAHYIVVAPSAPVATAFGHVIAPLFRRSAEAANESRSLAALLDALLPKLISGDLRVKDPAAFIEGDAS